VRSTTFLFTTLCTSIKNFEEIRIQTGAHWINSSRACSAPRRRAPHPRPRRAPRAAHPRHPRCAPSGVTRAFPRCAVLPEAARREAGRTPRQLEAWARYASRRHHVGLPLPALPATPCALLPAVTSLLCSSEATVEPPHAPIKLSLFLLSRWHRRARLAPPPASIAAARLAPLPLATTVDRPLVRPF
jgi:hypothetical protein